MALVVRNTRELIDPKNYKLKALIYGLPGSGKTEWAAGAPNPGVAACETGHGNGLLTIASRGLDYVEPQSYDEFSLVCSGQLFKDKDTIILDSLSDMARTFIKDYALTIPRTKGDTRKRQLGIPELDDYGTMGEVTRRLLRRLLDLDKHIVVTATLRIDKPDPENGQGALLIGPDLPGQLFLGSTAMFDIVGCIRTRPALKDPKDAKSRYNQRFISFEGDGTYVTKTRTSIKGHSLLAREEAFDLETGRGTFQDILAKIVAGYTREQTGT